MSPPPPTGWVSAPRPSAPPPTSPAAAPVKPEVWLFDTATLLSMAAVPAMQAAIEVQLSPQPCVLFDVVDDELTHLATRTDQTGLFARRARGQLAWLGPVASTSMSDVNRARAIQRVIAGTRPLTHARQHWAESVMIEIARRMTQSTPVLLSEDHDARVEAHQTTPAGEGPIASYSVHKLLSRFVRAGQMPAQDAEGFADALQQADRAKITYTAHDFATGRLRRVGQP